MRNKTTKETGYMYENCLIGVFIPNINEPEVKEQIIVFNYENQEIKLQYTEKDIYFDTGVLDVLFRYLRLHIEESELDAVYLPADDFISFCFFVLKCYQWKSIFEQNGIQRLIIDVRDLYLICSECYEKKLSVKLIVR